MNFEIMNFEITKKYRKTLICSKNTDKSLEECRGVQTNVDKCRRMQTSADESLDESRGMYTSLYECRRV